MNNKRLVIVGDKLYTIEEFMPGPGTYAYDDGYIRASQVGYLKIDLGQRLVIIRQARDKPNYPKPGDVVIGVVTTVSDDIAFIDIFQIEGVSSRSIDFSGVIHISQISEKYIKTMYEALRLGDIIRAKVLNDRSPFQLTTKGPQHGVILASCSKCGAILKRQSDDSMICPVCGNIEKRKVSIKYLYK